MADRTSAHLFGEVFRLIAEHVTDLALRGQLALKFWALKERSNCDFSDYQMCADDVLIELGLAHLGTDPRYPKDGQTVLYGPEEPKP